MRKRKSLKEMSWQEIAYGAIIIAFLAYMLYDSSVNGRGGNPTDNW